jgi:hypothetical protein
MRLKLKKSLDPLIQWLARLEALDLRQLPASDQERDKFILNFFMWIYGFAITAIYVFAIFESMKYISGPFTIFIYTQGVILFLGLNALSLAIISYRLARIELRRDTVFAFLLQNRRVLLIFIASHIYCSIIPLFSISRLAPPYIPRTNGMFYLDIWSVIVYFSVLIGYKIKNSDSSE